MSGPVLLHSERAKKQKIAEDAKAKANAEKKAKDPEKEKEEEGADGKKVPEKDPEKDKVPDAKKKEKGKVPDGKEEEKVPEKVVIEDVDEKVEAIRKLGDNKLEKWLKMQDVPQLEEVVRTLNFEEKESRVRAYVAEQKEKAPYELGICSKCRWRHGCEVCCYEKALRLVIKKQDVPAVYMRKEAALLKASKKFSKVVQYYQKIYDLQELLRIYTS